MPEAWLVGGDNWLPTEPFDFSSGLLVPVVGCNNIRCGACGQTVANARRTDSLARRYWCRCQERDVSGAHLIGADQGQVNEFITRWRCAGHAALALPSQLDGVSISATGLDTATTEWALAQPPFVAPGGAKPGFWIARLHQLLPDSLRTTIGTTVGALLSSNDPRVVSGAIGFFWVLPHALGAAELASVAAVRSAWLEATGDPFDAGVTLEDSIYDALQRRIAVRDSSGRSADPTALAQMERALLSGKNPSEIVLSVGNADPGWLAQHAADLVSAATTDATSIVLALKSASRAQLIAALRPIAGTSVALRAEISGALERYVAGGSEIVSLLGS